MPPAARNAVASVRIPAKMSATVGASKLAAPEGQTAEHAPQPAQIIGSIATLSPSGVIAPVGQRSRQRVQPVFCAREWAQSEGSSATCSTFSKVPTWCDASRTRLATARGSPGSARR